MSNFVSTKSLIYIYSEATVAGSNETHFESNELNLQRKNDENRKPTISRVRPSIFVRVVRRSHNTDYTIFQLARKSRLELERLFNTEYRQYTQQKQQIHGIVEGKAMNLAPA